MRYRRAMSTHPAAGAQVDHLVVAAATLDDGVRWCESVLGVAPGPGGRHALMGTHNRLLSIAGAAFPDAYLELIAVDPDATLPLRRRWFGLDDASLQRSLRERGPRLLHVVARTTQLELQQAGLAALGLDVGVAVAMRRETPQGPLGWRIVVRDDGALLLGGMLPTLIEWQGRHPAAAMPASGVVLEALALHGLPAAARDVLRLRGVGADAAVAPPAIVATLRTPRGSVTLRSDACADPTQERR